MGGVVGSGVQSLSGDQGFGPHQFRHHERLRAARGVTDTTDSQLKSAVGYPPRPRGRSEEGVGIEGPEEAVGRRGKPLARDRRRRRGLSGTRVFF